MGNKIAKLDSDDDNNNTYLSDFYNFINTKFSRNKKTENMRFFFNMFSYFLFNPFSYFYKNNNNNKNAPLSQKNEQTSENKNTAPINFYKSSSNNKFSANKFELM